MKATVTPRDELEQLTSVEMVREYGQSTDTATRLAALADATDCVYFEGRLPDGGGGVVRVEFVDAGTVFADLAEVLTGFHVSAVEPLVFSPESALEAAAEDEQYTAETVDELRSEFHHDHGLSYETDAAARLELVGA